MLDTSSVTAKFLIVSGLAESDSQIEALCACSALKIGEMLKDAENSADERVIYAAACDAYYQWILIGCTASDESFKSMKAGDITVTSDPKAVLNAAKALRDSSLESASSLLSDSSFYFSEVDIDDA